MKGLVHLSQVCSNGDVVVGMMKCFTYVSYVSYIQFLNSMPLVLSTFFSCGIIITLIFQGIVSQLEISVWWQHNHTQLEMSYNKANDKLTLMFSSALVL